MTVRPTSSVKQIVRQAAVLMLRGYKWMISPWFPPSCRYVPTCSEYAMEAVERYGVWRGGSMALVRILRCHPFVRGGYDPVVAGINRHTRGLVGDTHSSILTRGLDAQKIRTR